MDDLLASHSLSPSFLRKDDFEMFIQDRRQQLIDLIAKAMGKDVVEQGEYE